jgi:hypothetical protein
MLLYHGTSEEAAKIALKEGLKPRRGTGVKSNWEHTIASNPANVYLTHCYAPYFAMSASKGEAGSVCQPSMRPMRWAIIEIDTDKLDGGCLLPDEDFLEQVSRSREEDIEALGLEDTTMEERTRWFRDNLQLFQSSWGDSVRYLGNCCFRGDIPPEAITRVSFFDAASNPPMGMMATDPSITLMNHAICSEKYIALTKWMMGDGAEPHEFDSMLTPEIMESEGMPEEHRQLYKTRLTELSRILTIQDGIEVVCE